VFFTISPGRGLLKFIRCNLKIFSPHPAGGGYLAMWIVLSNHNVSSVGHPLRHCERSAAISNFFDLLKNIPLVYRNFAFSTLNF
jgi:hypothetical protein